MNKNSPKTEIQLLVEITEKLDMLIAFAATADKERDEKIFILAGLGYSNSQISKLTNIPKGTVDGIRAKIKRK